MDAKQVLNVSALARTFLARATALLMRTDLGVGEGDSPTLANLTVNSRTALTTWALSLVAGTDANTTMAANTRYDVDMSAWATADRNYTLPTNAAVGDEIEIYAQIGNATYELILKTGAGQTCAFGGSTIAAATEITRLFITGEMMRFRYHATNKWECVEDGRIAQKGSMSITTAPDGETAATYTRPTQAATPGAWTVDTNVGGVCSASGDSIATRRAGTCEWAFNVMPKDTVGDQKYFGAGLFKNGTTQLLRSFIVSAATGTGPESSDLRVHTMTAGDSMVFQYRSEEGGIGCFSSAAGFTHMSMKELLP